MQKVQLKAMQQRGKVIASQVAKSLFEPMGKVPYNELDTIVDVELEPILKENITVNDVIYIKLFDVRKKIVWQGGVRDKEVANSSIPLYDRTLIQKGKKKPVQIEKIGAVKMHGLTPLQKLANKIVGLKDIYYDISAPVTLQQLAKANGEIHIGFSQRSANIAILDIIRIIIFIGLIFTAGGLLFSIIFSFFFTKPISRLKDAMVAIGKGDLNQHVKITAKDEVGLLTWNFNNMTAELREKERMRDSFGKAVSEEIVEVMMAGDLFLGGEEKDVTMLFSDIRSFTKLSSSLNPSEVMSMLNEYFTLMEYVVNKNMGIIDKYVGDEIMSIFGATDPNQDHAEDACRTAIEMIIELDKLNEKRKNEGKMPIRIGIGINSGLVTAGMLGSENRMNYTVIGDTVNMASRLCDAGGTQGFAPIVIAEDTYEKVKNIVMVRSGHAIAVKGKDKPVKIYELLGIVDRQTSIQIKIDSIMEKK